MRVTHLSILSAFALSACGITVTAQASINYDYQLQISGTITSVPALLAGSDISSGDSFSGIIEFNSPGSENDLGALGIYNAISTQATFTVGSVIFSMTTNNSSSIVANSTSFAGLVGGSNVDVLTFESDGLATIASGSTNGIDIRDFEFGLEDDDGNPNTLDSAAFLPALQAVNVFPGPDNVLLIGVDADNDGFADTGGANVIRATIDSASFVPEPSSLALLGMGGLILSRRRRG